MPNDVPFKNPGWAGNTGEFDLTEEEVRGDDFVGERPLHGGHASGAGTMPYMLANKSPEAPLFQGDYEQRLEKILTRYPNIKSIRDFGSVFGNPWKDKFFTLFGQPSYLDYIEHEVLRKEGVYDDPRVHVAVVCASVGCPMLRNEAFVPERLEAQLEDAMRRFMSDRTRNRYNAASGKLEASKIFDWYGKDFEKGHKGYGSVKQTLSRYADQLAEKPEDRAAVRAQKPEVAFLDYDWGLNDLGR